MQGVTVPTSGGFRVMNFPQTKATVHLFATKWGHIWTPRNASRLQPVGSGPSQESPLMREIAVKPRTPIRRLAGRSPTGCSGTSTDRTRSSASRSVTARTLFANGKSAYGRVTCLCESRLALGSKRPAIHVANVSSPVWYLQANTSVAHCHVVDVCLARRCLSPQTIRGNCGLFSRAPKRRRHPVLHIMRGIVECSVLAAPGSESIR